MGNRDPTASPLKLTYFHASHFASKDTGCKNYQKPYWHQGSTPPAGYSLSSSPVVPPQREMRLTFKWFVHDKSTMSICFELTSNCAFDSHTSRRDQSCSGITKLVLQCIFVVIVTGFVSFFPWLCLLSIFPLQIHRYKWSGSDPRCPLVGRAATTPLHNTFSLHCSAQLNSLFSSFCCLLMVEDLAFDIYNIDTFKENMYVYSL